jgi:hypothetical protein
MKWLLLLLPFGSVVLLLLWLMKRSGANRPVSEAWLTDHQRRSNGVGVDQACVRSWPINANSERDLKVRG